VQPSTIQGTIQSSAESVHMRPAKWKLCVQLGQRSIDAFGPGAAGHAVCLPAWQGGIGKLNAN
jgi:hypothetical protein